MEMIQNNNAERTIENHTEILLLLKKACRTAYKKAAKKLKKQNEEYEAAAKWLLNRQIGDSLLASVREIKKGVSECNLLNVHSQQWETVALNPKLDPVKNAQNYYRKAKKGKRGFEICKEMLRKTEAALEHIGNVIKKIDACPLLSEDTEEFRTAFHAILEDTRNLNSTSGAPPDGDTKKNVPTVPYRHYIIDGWDIYIGRNNLQNDELTLKFAKPWDILLHVSAHPGSHVVIRRQKNSDWPPRPVLERAASFAVWFSQARYTSYAEVHVCEVRFVTKPRKSPAGQVIMKKYKTVRVSPVDPQQVVKTSRR